MAEQYGFYFDADRCVQCRACETACKSSHDIEPGPRWRQVIDIWEGEVPQVTRNFFSLACMHCRRPACIEVCPTGAITKRAEDGIVVVDSNNCNGCQACSAACPYDVPQFGADGTMQKCDFCIELGREPACAATCPAEALSYGTMEKLSRLAKANSAKILAGPTRPSIFVLNILGNNIIHKKYARQL
jgi:anaerobic dimethyl sulfoxide reductase subunit B (iron-sulfur subunit)